MKTLILIRHANALSAYEARVQTDAERPLSQAGLVKAAASAQELLRQSLRPNIILTSPLLRAVQTAEILAQHLQAPVSKETVLNGLHDDRTVCEFLTDQLSEHEVVAAVGHNPNIAYVTHVFCKQVLHFSPGSFAVLNFEDPHHPQLTFFGE